MALKVGDIIEITEDGGMIRKGDRWTVLEISANGKFFYYCGNLALSVNSKKYKIINMENKKEIYTDFEVKTASDEIQEKIIEMAIDRKYFTPNLEDIRVGYEYEKYIAGSGNKYEKLIFNGELIQLQFFINCYKQNLQEGWIRVPYLTKEQIEAEGWKFKGRAIDSWFEKEDIFLRDDGHHFTKITVQYGFHDYRLVIKVKFVGGEEDKFFEGECKDINTFRYICKLLNIK